jgi:hypothetical protein
MQYRRIYLAVRNNFPKDLAKELHSELMRQKGVAPPLTAIVNLVESMYFASMMTEESQPISFHAVYLDPANSHPDLLDEPSRDIWSCVKLPESNRIPLTPANLPKLVKIARALDPRTSSLAVWRNSQGVFVWGLVDQGNSYDNYVKSESERGYERPGLFQLTIEGIGHLAAHIGLEKVAELRRNEMLMHSSDVLREGPVCETLQLGLNGYVDAVKQSLTEEDREVGEDYTSLIDLPEEIRDLARHEFFNAAPYTVRDYISDYWTDSLCRLLLRVQHYRHGGAVLITPHSSSKLEIKYPVKYERLREALQARARLQIESDQNLNRTDELERTSDIPRDLFANHLNLTDELVESSSELDGVIWFISLLTRVDGLVLMNPDLEVLGFGVVITEDTKPTSVFVASHPSATNGGLEEDDYNHYGTRHRSMMRYCANWPGSVGFVASQDGEVRAITKVDDRVVIWKNVRLRRDDFIRRNRRTSLG